MGQDKYVRFDWAAKNLLRRKENFVIPEGLVSVLLKEEIHITDILESEGNQEHWIDKFNKVGIKARNSKGERIFIEIIFFHIRDYYKKVWSNNGFRSRATDENGIIPLSSETRGFCSRKKFQTDFKSRYDQVNKVYSINIIYLNFGKGIDFVYHGQTKFIGMTTGDTLKITKKENDVIRIQTPESIFPEYYIIRVYQYNKPDAANYIEEWLDYLRTGHIKDDTQTPGLKEALDRLLYVKMSKQEQIAYDRYIDDIMVDNDCFDTAIKVGFAIGEKEGRAEGETVGMEKERAEGEAFGFK